MRFSWLCVPALVALFAVPGAARAHTAADYAAAVRKVEQMVAGQGFTVLLEKPFVVAGDEEADVVLTRSESTVRWAVRKLKQSYFTRDPNHILTVWLFKDEVSYRKHAKKLFGHTPTTPFGYYSSTAKALIMNISTGGGTLVHEIVHPFMESNFPSCPAWFNEALGSLYEQCAERGGKIAGLTNWRLAGLQRAIRAGTVPSFRTLTHTTDVEFYDEDPGTNYSQSRYLVYYLQERGLLRRFYHAFRAARLTDPTGYRTLKKILGEEDMGAFKQRWEGWVEKLAFP